LKKTYGPGDTVEAAFKVRGLDDQPLKGHALTYTVRLGSKTFFEEAGKTDDQGKALVRFTLPDTLEDDGGLLNVALDYQGSSESMARPLLCNFFNITSASSEGSAP